VEQGKRFRFARPVALDWRNFAGGLMARTLAEREAVEKQGDAKSERS
jgi:hypothetical protein